jgi:hypothetical protein
MEVLRIVAPWYFYGANEGRLIAYINFMYRDLTHIFCFDFENENI